MYRGNAARLDVAFSSPPRFWGFDVSPPCPSACLRIKFQTKHKATHALPKAWVFIYREAIISFFLNFQKP